MAIASASKETFHTSKEYLALTDKQRVWVDSFADSQDAALATRIAYGDQADSAYRAMLTRKIETSLRVIAALDLYFARSPREKFLRDLENDIAHSKGVAKIEGRRLWAKVTGLVDGSPTDDSEPAAVLSDPRVPVDYLEVWSDRKTGVVIGYRAADGTTVKLL